MVLKDKIRIIPRKLIVDERGWFLKAITGTEEDIPQHIGEVYLTMGKAGQIKGGHYHPKALEWFTLISGKAVLKLEDVVTHEKLQLDIDFEDAVTVFVPNMVAHSWESAEEQGFIVLAYTDLRYDPKDTVAYKL